MSNILPADLELLRQAAELRANGSNWKEVATELATDLPPLRILAAKHARTYGSLMRHAKREAWHDTMNETVGNLRKLLKSPNEEVVMKVGLAFLKYDLGKMRRAGQIERAQPAKRRTRDDLPPPPSWRVTAESTRCDSQDSAPETQEREEVIAKSTVVQNARCDSVTVTSDRMTTAPVTMPNQPPPPPATKQAAAPTVLKSGEWKPDNFVVSANRRKKWIPFALRKNAAPPIMHQMQVMGTKC